MIWRIPLEARDSLEMAALGVMVGKPSLRMRVADGVSMITQAGCILSVSGAVKSNQRHARHRAGASRVLISRRNMKISEKYRFVQFCIFCVGWFFELISSCG